MPKTPKKPTNLSTHVDSADQQIDEVRRIAEENLRYTKKLASQPGTDAGSLEVIEDLLKQNIQLSKQVLATSKKIRRWTIEQRVWGIVKLLIIIIPLVLGIIYLPPLIRKAVEPYKGVLEQVQGAQSSFNPFNLFGGNKEEAEPVQISEQDVEGIDLSNVDPNLIQQLLEQYGR